MKMIDTLTEQQKLNILSGQIDGIFMYLLQPTDPFYNICAEMCMGYYFEHSAYKTTSPFVNRLIEDSGKVAIPFNVNQLVAKYVRTKFIDKWIRVYNTIITERYNPLDSYERVRDTSVEADETVTYGRTENSTMSYNTDTTDISRENTKITTTNTDNEQSSIYGFNSVNGVPQNEASASNTQITSGSGADNNTETTEQKRGSDSTTRTNGGEDLHERNRNETETVHGREGSPAKLIQQEIDMRKRNIFLNIVYDDIDSVTTLSIYI